MKTMEEVLEWILGIFIVFLMIVGFILLYEFIELMLVGIGVLLVLGLAIILPFVYIKYVALRGRTRARHFFLVPSIPSALALGLVIPSVVSISPMVILAILFLPIEMLFVWVIFLSSPEIQWRALPATLLIAGVLALAMSATSGNPLWAVFWWIPIILIYFLRQTLDRSLIDRIGTGILMLSLCGMFLGIGIGWGEYYQWTTKVLPVLIPYALLLMIIVLIGFLIAPEHMRKVDQKKLEDQKKRVRALEYQRKEVLKSELRNRIEDLKGQLGEDIITQEEYEEKKKELLEEYHSRGIWVGVEEEVIGELRRMKEEGWKITMNNRSKVLSHLADKFPDVNPGRLYAFFLLEKEEEKSD